MNSHHLLADLLPLRCAVLCLLALTLVVGNADAGRLGDELQQRLATAATTEPIKVTIRFADKVDLTPYRHRSDRKTARRELVQALRGRAAASQGPLQRQLRGQGHKVSELWLINALATELPAGDISALAAWPGVASIELTGTTPPPEPAPLVEPLAQPLVDWNLTAIGVSDLQSALPAVNGSGSVVAVLDTGVDPNHPQLDGTKFRGQDGDWFNPYALPGSPQATTPYDFVSNGLTHGTAVTSVILGDSIGVAPGAKWIAAKIFPDSGSADNAKIHQAFAWALAPGCYPDYADGCTPGTPDLVNASWGFDQNINQCLAEFQADIVALQTAGIHVVFAAGNKGPNPRTSVSPANLPVGFAVGAATSVTAYNAATPGTVVSSFSSRGPTACTTATSPYLTPTGTDVFPELTAPGYNVVVANSASSTGYSSVAGTSFSAPHVSGALALLREAVPDAGQFTDYQLGLELALLDTAADFDLPAADQNAGFGLLDVAAAYYRLNGQPSLAVYTPGAPENDELVDFGNVPRDSSTDLDLRLSNVGGAALDLTLPAGLAPPYSVVNSCTSPLPADSTCNFTIRFTPTADGPAAPASFTVVSTDPRTASRTINLAGSANTAPPIPIPVAPADGAKNLQLPLAFSWYQGDDSDGDPLASTLYIGIDEEFQLVTPLTFTGNVIPQSLALLLLWPFPLLLHHRNRRLLPALLLASMLLSCGGGGGSSPAPPTPNYSVTVNSGDLDFGPGVNTNVFYWKVVTSDSQGNPVESPVRSFTTAP